MCLIISKPAVAPKITRELLDEVFRRNSDGFGVMFMDPQGGMKYIKELPATSAEAAALYDKYAANNAAMIHWRQRTHGAVDKDNCHPYKVTPHIYMMHNGILPTSNPTFKDKSDTWHYIEYILKPALTSNPDLLLDEGWCEFIGANIGSGNKFAFMRSDGKTTIINRGSGLEWEDCWFSNEYAWDVGKFMGGVSLRLYDSYYSDWGAQPATARRPFASATAGAASVGTKLVPASGKSSVNYVDETFDNAVKFVDLIDQGLTVTEVVNHHRVITNKLLASLKLSSTSDTASMYRHNELAPLVALMNDALYEIAQRFSINPLYASGAL